MHTLRTLLALLVVTCLLGPAADAAETYPIALFRPAAVDDSFTISAQVSTALNREITTLDGKVVDKSPEMSRTQLGGTLTVLAISAEGRIDRMRLEISKLDVDGKPATLAPTTVTAGSVLIATRQEEKDSFSFADEKTGKALPKDPLDDLNFALQLVQLTPEEQEQYGSDEPQAVGASWPVETGMIAESLRSGSLMADVEDMKGSAKLVEVKEVDGVPAMHIITQVTIDQLGSPHAAMTVKSSGAKLEAEVWLPLDPSKQPLKQTGGLTMNMVLEGKPGPDLPTMRVTVSALMIGQTILTPVE